MTSDKITLDVEDCPTIETGDTLLIRSAPGGSYRADVLDVDDRGRLVCRVRATDEFGQSIRAKHRYSADELEGWYVRADLMINPPDDPRQ